MILCSIGWLSDPWKDLVSTLLPQHRPRSGGCLWLSLSCVWLFCSPVDYSLSGFSVHGIVQARILERVAISFSRGSSRTRNQTCYRQAGSLSLSHQESPTGIPLVWNWRVIFVAHHRVTPETCFFIDLYTKGAVVVLFSADPYMQMIFSMQNYLNTTFPIQWTCSILAIRGKILESRLVFHVKTPLLHLAHWIQWQCLWPSEDV